MIKRVYHVPVQIDDEDIDVLQYFYSRMFPTREKTDENIKLWIGAHLNMTMLQLLDSYKNKREK